MKIALLLGLLGFAQLASGVEESRRKITDRWSVVGVISSDDKNGVVVMKDMVSRKTFTLKIGARLPSDPQFRIKTAKRNQVQISDGAQRFVLRHILDDSKDSGYEEETSFADSYYSRFDPLEEGNLSIYQFQNLKKESDPEDVPMPLGQFRNLTNEESRDRAEKYRARQTFFSNTTPVTDYEVSYDNFSEDEETWSESVVEEESAEVEPEVQEEPLTEVVDEGEEY